LFLIPVFLVVFYLPTKSVAVSDYVTIPFVSLADYPAVSYASMIAALIFLLAAITDMLDGYLARKLEQSSEFGAFLDPVADKLIVAVTLIALVQRYADLWITIPAFVIIGREIMISALREWMAERGLRNEVAVSWIGKWKTAAQMLALVGLISELPLLSQLGWLLLYVATVLTIWSMVDYFSNASKVLFKES
jgi:CDP-diacylglycerol--glycerol-3-phosphate 3-phosphatidyltransferase